jgi:hypothetical protein
MRKVRKCKWCTLGLEAHDRYLLKIVKNSTITRLSTYFYHYVSNTTTISGDIL